MCGRSTATSFSMITIPTCSLTSYVVIACHNCGSRHLINFPKCSCFWIYSFSVAFFDPRSCDVDVMLSFTATNIQSLHFFFTHAQTRFSYISLNLVSF